MLNKCFFVCYANAAASILGWDAQLLLYILLLKMWITGTYFINFRDTGAWPRDSWSSLIKSLQQCGTRLENIVRKQPRDHTVEEKPPSLLLLLHLNRNSLWYKPEIWCVEATQNGLSKGKGVGIHKTEGEEQYFRVHLLIKLLVAAIQAFWDPGPWEERGGKLLLLLWLCQHNWICLLGRKRHITKLLSGRVGFWGEKGSFYSW